MSLHEVAMRHFYYREATPERRRELLHEIEQNSRTPTPDEIHTVFDKFKASRTVKTTAGVKDDIGLPKNDHDDFGAVEL